MKTPITAMEKDLIKSWILSGIPIIIILAGAMHFIYDLSGSLPMVGLLAPVNESVWEHLKLGFVPLLFWWLVSYLILKRRTDIYPEKWFLSFAAAELVCPLFVLSFYYVKTGAFGIHSLALDIASLCAGVALAQAAGLHIYRYAVPSRSKLFLSAMLIVLLMSSFILLTFYPPHLPVFMDSLTGKYGA
jgi:hypothetical protein